MLGHRMMGKYVLVKKSTLLFGGLAAAGLLGYKYYKDHRAEVKKEIDNLTDDMAGVAKKGARKAKEVAEEAKA